MIRQSHRTLFFVALLASTEADACPLCDSATGDRVRAEIRSEFGANLLATTLPFGACLGLGALVSAAVAWKSRVPVP